MRAWMSLDDNAAHITECGQAPSAECHNAFKIEGPQDDGGYRYSPWLRATAVALGPVPLSLASTAVVTACPGLACDNIHAAVVVGPIAIRN